MNKDQAEMIAVDALAHLAGDEEQLSRFIAISGMAPEDLRAAANEPSALAGVLEFFVQFEPALIAFAEQSGHRPDGIVAACRALGGLKGQEW